jgi:Fe-S cluster biosynthesis and repair protein YggX
MTLAEERIAQLRKMATDDPDNDLGHYRLGKLLLEEKHYGEAIPELRRTLQLNPQFSKVYHLLAQALLHDNQREECIKALREGFDMASERGDHMPRDEMARMLIELGEPAPIPKHTVAAPTMPLAGGELRCQRPGCLSGGRGRPLEKPPFNDELGRRIQEKVCAACWEDWRRNYSVKVINELRLDLSSDAGAAEYDRYMREFLGLD